MALTVDAEAPAERRIADDHCPGVYCVRNPIELRTQLAVVDAEA